MGMIDHWHPVLFSRGLRRKPVGVRLAGQPIVLFRTPEGVGALTDVCPPRRMRLSQRAARLFEQPADARRRQRAVPRDQIFQVGPLEQLHRVIEDALGRAAVVVDRHRVGV